MSDLEEAARALATRAHAAIDQRRKYTNDPYIVHPAAVVELVRSVPHTEEQIAAAWLHDTVEDAGVTLSNIVDHCGYEVAALVEMLTDVSRPEDGNRAKRKAIDLAHTAKCSAEAATVKIADLISNSETILAYDRDFARVYIKEKARTLEVLRHGDPTLHAMATEIVTKAMKELFP